MGPVPINAFLLFLFSLQAFAVQKVQIATYDILPPFAFRKSGNLTGVYIEIVKEAVAKMPDYQVEFKVNPWARAKDLIEQGPVFGILPPYFHAHDWLTKTEPKKPYIWPYSLQLFEQTDVVYCHKKVMKTPRERFPDDYKGLSEVSIKKCRLGYDDPCNMGLFSTLRNSAGFPARFL